MYKPAVHSLRFRPETGMSTPEEVLGMQTSPESKKSQDI